MPEPMKLTHTEALNLAILDDIHRLNQSFIKLALRQWDIDGQGCFATFIKVYTFRCWQHLTRLN